MSYQDHHQIYVFVHVLKSLCTACAVRVQLDHLARPTRFFVIEITRLNLWYLKPDTRIAEPVCTHEHIVRILVECLLQYSLSLS